MEGAIGFGRRNFLVPMPRFESFDALNARLEEQCLARQDAVLRGHAETIGERLLRDLDALIVLPAAPYDACEKVGTRAFANGARVVERTLHGTRLRQRA